MSPNPQAYSTLPSYSGEGGDQFLDFPNRTERLPGGLTLSPLELDFFTSRYDLTHYVWDEAGRTKGYIEYNTVLFDPSTIVRLIGQLETLLEGFVSDPGERI